VTFIGPFREKRIYRPAVEPVPEKPAEPTEPRRVEQPEEDPELVPA